MPFIAIVYAANDDAAQAIMTRERGKIVGLYRFPAKADEECPGYQCPGARHENVYGYGRHHEHGYMVHGNCQRRPKGFRRKIKLSLLGLFGLNLLPRDITPAIFRNPEKYDHPDVFPPL